MANPKFSNMFTEEAKRVLRIAAELVSEDGSNVEYDRAVVEMTASILGVSTEHSDMITAAIASFID